MFRTDRWLPFVAALFLLALAVESGIARASAEGLWGIEVAQPYRAGPRDRRAAVSSFEWPRGADELLALGVLAAILCGFRVSGLARHSRAGWTDCTRNAGSPRASTR
ncbi:MAG: hypothetical protein GY910_19090 [bacterium]|nr:hypothetical protein [Deltaproteobacteria bacterium]MCP4907086.1 hypothetical protein [bacterium]